VARKKESTPKAPECALCGDQDVTVDSFGGRIVCQFCLDRARNGRDTATRAARALAISRTERATASLLRESGDDADAAGHEDAAVQYAEKAAALFRPKTVPAMALGEAVPLRRSQLADTLKAPNVVALDASAHRLELLGRLGVECTAMALDASDSIKAENSLEKMLAHQLAVAHKTSLDIAAKAALEQNTTEKARMLNLAARMMEVFQRGLLTLQRLRTGGDQRIFVQHVTVSDGGQAIVGNVKVGGAKE
jgi:hypothetical protein